MKKFLVGTITLLLLLMAFSACGTTDSTIDSSSTESPSSVSPSPEMPSPSDSPSEMPSPYNNPDNQVGSGTIGNHDVAIIGYELTEDYDGNPTVVVTYEWTNNSDAAASFIFTFANTVYQNGVECEKAIILNVDVYDIEDSTKDIKPGVTYTVKGAYVLGDTTSPIEVELTELLSFASNPPMVTRTFEIA